MDKEKAKTLIKKGMCELTDFLCDNKITGVRDGYKYFQQALKELED